MANQEHLNILKQGVQVWNKWRKEHDDIEPDLSGAHLAGVHLHEANFGEQNPAEARGVNLNRANLRGADLSGAFLRHANLSGADLRAYLLIADLVGADLREADLRGAHLTEADLTNANLRGANLSEAYLYLANLREADLGDANLSHAKVGRTTFGDVDLSVVKELDTVEHQEPSTIGIDTIYRSKGNIPEIFLKGAGVDDTFITYIRSLVGKAIEYYSCFISYSSHDEAFANRLYADWQNNNVRCWFAPEDLKIGEKFWHRIDESIRLYDKLLVVLSEHSVESEWVEREVIAALEKERQQKRLVLFPITLDEAFKQTSAPWVAEIRRTRHIGDFRNWKNHDEYEKAFNRLLRDLKSEA